MTNSELDMQQRGDKQMKPESTTTGTFCSKLKLFHVPPKTTRLLTRCFMIILCVAVVSRNITLLVSISNGLRVLLDEQHYPKDFIPKSPGQYSLKEVGYPPSRIELKDLNLCDLGWAGMPRKSRGWVPLECPKQHQKGTFDPTCQSCLSTNSLEEGKTHWKVYIQSQSSRTKTYQTWYGREKVVVVVASDQKYIQMLINWWCHAEKQGLHSRNVLVYAYSEEVAVWAESKNIRSVSPSLYNITIPKRLESQFKWSLFPLFLDLLHLGKHVIFNDIDMIWTRDMSLYLPALWPEIHLVTQLAPRSDAQGTLNSGVMSLRPTRELIVFVETLMSTILIFLDGYQGPSDQIMWNYLLRHHKFRSLTWRTLPSSVILNAGWDPMLKGLSNNTMAIHWVGRGDKDSRMEEGNVLCVSNENID